MKRTLSKSILTAGQALPCVQPPSVSAFDESARLGNRTLLEREMLSGSTQARPALLLMDLDGFKRINDTLGHAAGDELLVAVARDLRRVVRSGDVLVRLGGDEFALLLHDVDESDALSAATRMLQVLDSPHCTRGVTLRVEASVGVAITGADLEPGALLQAADIAMYRAKRGKLGVYLYSPADAAQEERDLELLIDLREALEHDGLHLAFQPTCALQPGATPFIEVLARWTHPVHGPIPPDRFIQFAEDTALIHELTAWVLDQAVEQCAQWHVDGLAVTIAVNISSQSLAHPGLVQLVIDTLARHQLPASALHLEITETAIVARPEVARDILQQLVERGVALSIDDFGAGYTSLAQLQTMPVTELKIDKQFVLRLTEGGADAAIVSAVIGLAHALGMRAVAEGVEDAHTLHLLRALDCDIAQGYHISRPLPAARAAQWLQRAATDVTVEL